MEARKRELQELSERQRFRGSDELATFKIINSIKELVAATSTLISSAKNGFLYVVPSEMLVITSLLGINAEAEKLIKPAAQQKR